MRLGACRRAALARAFLALSSGYWLDVFPRVRGELRSWRRLALDIPNAGLREAALASLDCKAGNVEGAAAFAVLAPRARRPQLIRLLVAYQAMHDYLDTISEQRVDDVLANGRQLHEALVVALDDHESHRDYYRFHADRDDGGYLMRYVEACQEGVGSLPGYPEMAHLARRAAWLSGEAQSRLHAGDGWDDGGLWARPFLSGPVWLDDWEVAAAACSTLTIYALLAFAAGTGRRRDAVLIEGAYFPWITGVSTLLDSLADEVADAAAGSYSHVGSYTDDAQASHRLGALIAEALDRAWQLPAGERHGLLLCGMLGYYLVGSATSAPTRLLRTRRELAATCVPLRRPIMFIFWLRGQMARLSRLPNVQTP